MANDSSIRVRMYRVGLGDCFLVSFPVGNSPTHVLIDCGVHARGDIGTLGQVVQNIAQETDRKLAVVIATHAHQDHISGFGKYASEFRKFSIGEVWMPWTENSADPTAAKLKQKRRTAIERLQMYFTTLAPAALARADDAVQAIANVSGNEAALEQLNSGFGVGAKVHYWKAGDAATAPGGIAGLQASVLGPPTNPDFLARMDPPPAQHYMAANGGNEQTVQPPFAPKWGIAGDSLRALLSADDIAAIARYAEEPPDALAFAIDQVVNNTSLVVLFSFAGKHLLFPGDAQYGNWQYWLAQSDAAHILAEIDFLKVAHHGSLNATPKQAIDNMGTGNLAAMVSTQNKPWPSIPREPLMQAIALRTSNHLVRSDSLAVKGAPATGPAVPNVPSGFERGDFWFDYHLPL